MTNLINEINAKVECDIKEGLLKGIDLTSEANESETKEESKSSYLTGFLDGLNDSVNESSLSDSYMDGTYDAISYLSDSTFNYENL